MINWGYLLFCFILISWGVPLKFNKKIIITMSQFDWPSSKKKKLKLWRLPKIDRFYGKMECLPLWPTYIGEKGRTLGKNKSYI
jgi:hypothetical protein